MLNILEVSAESPSKLYGGLGMHVRELSFALTNKVNLHLLAPEKTEDFPYDFSCPCFPATNAPTKALEFVFENQQALIVEALKICNQKQFDAVHFHDWPTFRVAQAIKYIHPKIAIIGTFHLFQMEVLMKEDIKPTPDMLYATAQERNGLIQADRVILCSSAMVSLAKDLHHIVRDFDMIYNGVRADTFPQHRGSGENKPVILFCGRYARQKGFELVCEAIEHTDKYQWIVLGHVPTPDKEILRDHPYTQRLKALKMRYPNRLLHYGWAEEDPKRRYMSIADVGIIPSEFEPFGIVALEFLAAGLPIVSTRVQGLGEFLHDENSVKMEMTVESMLSSIDLALSHKTSMVQGGYITTRQERFNWEYIAQQTLTVYEKSVSGEYAGWDIVNEHGYSVNAMLNG